MSADDPLLSGASSPFSTSVDEVDPLARTGVSMAGVVRPRTAAINRSLSLSRGDAVGRYVVLERLGAGGMGVVYAAYDPELDRKIALKLLHAEGPGGKSGSAKGRLLREAQAMARLSHPNVITVHDVGTFGDEVFVAMEFVDGPTLTEWLRGRPKLPAILDVFLRAGKGLAAAHGAGLVHRDFKPDNVLLGKDGRVCVADFGLARPQKEATAPAEAAPEIGELLALHRPHGPLPEAGIERITRTGLMMGTPAYMSPEQFLGRPTDARTDQFSYCVALYEAVYGDRPFDGDNIHLLSQAVMSGQIKAAPKEGRVPAWLRRLLLRGLANRPDDRFPNMEALLQVLTHGTEGAPRRRYRIAAAAVVAGIATLSAFSYRAAHRDRCGGAGQRLFGIWDDERKARVQAAFAATGKPYASRVFAAVERSLDAYAATWTSTYTEACRATRERGEQSEELLDLRMGCLSDHLNELEALTTLFTRADGTIVEKGLQATHGLSGLELCSDTRSLRSQVRPPADPAVRRKVEAVRADLATGKALKHAGKFHDGLRLTEAALQTAAGLSYRPIEAEALYLLGDIQGEAGDLRGAERHLSEAVWAAEAGHHDKVAARAAARLVSVVGSFEARYQEGHQWGRHAAAYIEAVGGDEQLEAKLHNSLGVLCSAEGRYDEALDHHRKALALRMRLDGPDHPVVAESLNNLGEVFRQTGQNDESLRDFQKALGIWEKALGPEHPKVAASLDHLGDVLDAQGKTGEGLSQHRQALPLLRKALGPDHPEVATCLASIGHDLLQQGDDDEAWRTLLEARRIRQQTLGPEHPDVGLVTLDLGRVLLHKGQYPQALSRQQEALSLFEKAQGQKGPRVVPALIAVGETLVAQQKGRAARPFLLRARGLCQAGPCQPADEDRIKDLLSGR